MTEKRFLPISSIVTWLNDHEDLLDEPFITPEGEFVTGVAGHPAGVLLLTEVAEPE